MENEGEGQTVSIILSRMFEAQSNNEKAIVRLDTKFDKLCDTLQQYINEVNNSSKAVDKFGVLLTTMTDKLKSIEKISHEPPCKSFVAEMEKVEKVMEEVKRVEDMVTSHIQKENTEKEENRKRWSARAEKIVIAIVLLIVTGACACLWSGLKISLAQ